MLVYDKEVVDMSTIMKPFIGIYHIVSSILDIPSKALKNKKENIEEAIEQKKLENAKKEDTYFDDERIKKVIKPKKKLISYKYKATNENNKKVSGIFDADSESDVRGFLTSQGYKVETVAEKKPYDIELNVSGKVKKSTLAFDLTQLSTYIKAGIPLVDAVKILSKQSHGVTERRAYQRVVYDLLKGENLSTAMMNQGDKFPRLLINMIKTAEMTGDLSTVLDDMADYYTSMEQTRKQMISAMTYPVVVILLAIGVLVFMLMYLVPQFVQLFESQNATLPLITIIIVSISDYLKAHFISLTLIVGGLIFIFYYLYNNVYSFRRTIQTILMHLPVFGNIIIYNEVANFTKTFASLLNHGVFITDSMEVLSKITDNEIYKGIIRKTLNNLSKGETISTAFKGEWAFPVVAYEMLVTGENTGQLGLMMEKVADHFQNLHKTLIGQLKSLIEPLMIVVLAIIVGVILLSIIVPMFDIYGQIK